MTCLPSDCGLALGKEPISGSDVPTTTIKNTEKTALEINKY